MKEKISCKMTNRQYYLWTDRCEWTDELTDEYYEWTDEYYQWANEY